MKRIRKTFLTLGCFLLLLSSSSALAGYHIEGTSQGSSDATTDGLHIAGT